MSTEKFWTEKYLQNETGWDIGYASTPIVEYIDQLDNKNKSILIPGAGNGHEAIYLHNNGFTNITVCDISSVPLINLSKACTDFPSNKLLQQDFFRLNQKYDLIIEQTFFCALNPSLREAYAAKMNDLLTTGGKLVGLLFAREFEQQGPPWGGTKEAYIEILAPHFEILKMEIAQNSIPSRTGNEYFIILKKK